MNLKKDIKNFAVGALFLLSSCSVTEKMGRNDVAQIKAPNNKAISKVLAKTNHNGLHFTADEKGDLYSQPVQLDKTYAVKFKYDSENKKTIAIAYNPEYLKNVQTQMHAVLELNDQTIKPEYLALINQARTEKPVQSTRINISPDTQ